MTRPIRSRRSNVLLPLTLAFIATIMGVPVHATVEVPDVPLQSAARVPPNIMFILDDSSSMTYLAMPEEVTRDRDLGNTPRHRSYVNNTIYYNPAVNYRGWQQANGIEMADTPETNAFSDQSLASGDINLRNSDQTFFIPNRANPTQDSHYDRYILRSGGGVRYCPGGTSCVAKTGSLTWSSVDADGNAVTITRTEAQERQNFANWYSYHRTRMKAAKAGAASAFSGLQQQDAYRVGFTTIWGPNAGAKNEEFLIPVNSNNGLFQNVAAEGGTPASTNRDTWFSRLFAAKGQSNTPLRSALQRVGEYYSRTDDDGPYGGLKDTQKNQLKCRQNFAILTTDGFWNADADFSIGNIDNEDGQVISRTSGTEKIEYKPVAPYKDGHSSTLADVAMHYWKTDLRLDMDNIVPVATAKDAFWQHMVTFGISIGLKGTIDQTSVAEVLTQGVTKGGASINWPDPTDTFDAERIDDLLHAAVNGHGEFIAAANPKAFADGLRAALGKIDQQTSSRSNLSANSTSLNAGSRVYQASYVGGAWTGRLDAFDAVKLAAKAPDALDWTASIPATGRKVYTDGGNFPTGTAQTALGSDVTDYIKGVRTKEGPAGTSGAFRIRSSLLGDIVHSSPVFVEGKVPPVGTDDTDDTVYVGANDGMLHAFDAESGKERFAYVPSGVNLANLAELTSQDYKHHFFVDGPIVVSDRSQTRTTTHPNGRNILVGTLGRGGKGIYALDVTDVESFGQSNVLWDLGGSEVDADMGYAIGNPIVVRLNSGDLGVIIPSGVSDDDPAIGSDKTILFVYNLETGDQVAKIDTGVDSGGLFSPRGWDDDGDGTVDFVYAGDLAGNLWKFDLSASDENLWSVVGDKPLFTAVVSGRAQPITGGVSISIDPATFTRWVFFGTGRLLSDADLDDRSVQSIYGVMDDDDEATITRGDLQQRSIISEGTDAVGRNLRGFEETGPLADDKLGWYVDLLDPPDGVAEGERIVGVPQTLAGVLLLTSGMPSKDACEPDGSGFVYAMDAYTGTSTSQQFFKIDVNGDGKVDASDKLGGNQVGGVGLDVGMIGDAIVQGDVLTAGGTKGKNDSLPINNPIARGRISWREINEE